MEGSGEVCGDCLPDVPLVREYTLPSIGFFCIILLYPPFLPFLPYPFGPPSVPTVFLYHYSGICRPYRALPYPPYPVPGALLQVSGGPSVLVSHPRIGGGSFLDKQPMRTSL